MPHLPYRIGDLNIHKYTNISLEFGVQRQDKTKTRQDNKTRQETKQDKTRQVYTQDDTKRQTTRQQKAKQYNTIRYNTIQYHAIQYTRQLQNDDKTAHNTT